MAIINRSTLNIGMLGNARAVLKMADNARLPIGVIYGIATKVKTVTNVDKGGNEQTFDEIRGQFEAVPAEAMEVTSDGKKVKVDRFVGGTLILPSAVKDMVTKHFETAKTPLKFGLGFTAIKTATGGFAWEIQKVQAPTVADPLDELRRTVAAAKTAKAK